MKIIHYCWFGKKIKPTHVEECINTWREYYPDYIIHEWNEDNFNIEDSNEFVKKAYKDKDWAFVSDYVRLEALYEYGGIYLDTDVIAIKRMEDLYLSPKNCILGFEDPITIGTAIIIAKKNSSFIKQLILAYFDKQQQDYLIPNVVLFSRFCLKSGAKMDNTNQTLKNDVIIFSNEFFYPKSFISKKIVQTNNTYFIHDFDSSWVKGNKIKTLVKNVSYKFLGENIYYRFVYMKRKFNGKY